MPAYVCSTAQMTCTFGATPSVLTVLPIKPMLSKKPMANIMDNIPMVNIATFGMCTSLSNPQVAAATSAAMGVLTPQPCVPNTVAPWAPGSKDVMIKGAPALLDNCKLMCLWGGNISFTTNGQTPFGCKTGAGGVTVTEKKAKKTPKTIVEFRTDQDQAKYDGEFGFDWLRINDGGLTTEKAYDDIILSGYKDGTNDLTKAEAQENIKKEYLQLNIFHKPVDYKYYIPYLNLFPKPFCDAFDAAINPKPLFKATLRVLVENDEDLDDLKILVSNPDISVSPASLTDLSKGAKKESATKLTVTCNKELTVTESITVVAIKDGIEELAGKIIVLPNDSIHRKTTKFVFVSVKTDVQKTGISLTGDFVADDSKYLRNVLYQALICPEIIEKGNNGLPIILDLSADKRFRNVTAPSLPPDPEAGMFITANKIDRHKNNGAALTYMKSKFRKDFPQYNDCFPIFSVKANVTNPSAGQVTSQTDPVTGKSTFVKNIYLYKDRWPTTLGHEALHGFQLYHTHRDGNPPLKNSNIKYIFPHASYDALGNNVDNTVNATENIISYNGAKRKYTWRWQWEIIRNNL